MFNKNKGYSGYSMSERAVDAYDNGEKPWSKWNKREIIESVLDINNNLNENLLKKIKLLNLKNEFLTHSSWHHTSKFFNETDFYSLNEEWLELITNEDLQNIIDKQKAEEKRAIDILQQDLQALMVYKKYTNYKTDNGFIKSIKNGKYNLEKLQKLKQKQEEKEAKKQKEYLLSLIEFSGYKSKNAYLEAIKNGKLNVKTLEKIRDTKQIEKEAKSISSMIDHLKIYIKHLEIVENCNNSNTEAYAKSKAYIDNNFKYDERVNGKNSLKVKEYIKELEQEKNRLNIKLKNL